MLHWIFTLFVLFHGLAHLVYTALARGWIPVAEGQQNWTGNSWILRGIGEAGLRDAGATIFLLLTLLFVVAAVGLAFRAPWSTNMVMIASIASSFILVTFWDGSTEAMVEKRISWTRDQYRFAHLGFSDQLKGESE